MDLRSTPAEKSGGGGGGRAGQGRGGIPWEQRRQCGVALRPRDGEGSDERKSGENKSPQVGVRVGTIREERRGEEGGGEVGV